MNVFDHGENDFRLLLQNVEATGWLPEAPLR
jgi:hypothetical protein